MKTAQIHKPQHKHEVASFEELKKVWDESEPLKHGAPISDDDGGKHINQIVQPEVKK